MFTHPKPAPWRLFTDFSPPGLPTVTCMINAPHLPVNAQKSFTSIVRVPKAVAQHYQCQIKNSARITAPLGLPKNWNPADDHA